ncbi:MAG: glycosyltransferase family 2 protein [Flammeovirgaceae bacterium]
MQNPLISIIIVTYNADKFLEGAIESVISQTYRNLELIVIDGGSEDNTLSIIKKYEKNVAYWISEPDKGLYDAMNKGIKASKGDYIHFLGADDRFYQNQTIEKIVEKIDPSADLIYGDFIATYNTFQKIKPAQSLTKLHKEMCFSHQALFTKSDLQKKYLFDIQYKIAADFHFIYRCFREGYNFQYIPITVALFNASGISAKKVVLGYQEVYRIVSQYGIDKSLHRFHRFRILKQTWIVRLQNLLGEKFFEQLMKWKYHLLH